MCNALSVGGRNIAIVAVFAGCGGEKCGGRCEQCDENQESSMYSGSCKRCRVRSDRKIMEMLYASGRGGANLRQQWFCGLSKLRREVVTRRRGRAATSDDGK